MSALTKQPQRVSIELQVRENEIGPDNKIHDNTLVLWLEEARAVYFRHKGRNDPLIAYRANKLLQLSRLEMDVSDHDTAAGAVFTAQCWIDSINDSSISFSYEITSAAKPNKQIL